MLPTAEVRAEVWADLRLNGPGLEQLDRSLARRMGAIPPQRAVVAALKKEPARTRAIGLSLAYQRGARGHAPELVWVVELNRPGGLWGYGTQHVAMDYAVSIVDAHTGAYAGGQAAFVQGLTPPPPIR